SSAGQQQGTAAPFQGFGTPSKPGSPFPTGQSSNLLGGGGASNFLQNPTSSAPATAATPAGKPSFSFAPVGSTTPGDPPPSSQAAGNNLFGSNSNNNNNNNNNQQQEKKSLFPSLGVGVSSSKPPVSSSIVPTQSATSSGFTMFGNSGNPQGSSPVQLPASTGSSNPFGNLSNQTSTATTGGQPAAPSFFAKPTQSLAAEAQKPSFSFPSSSTPASSQDAQQTPASAPSFFNLGGPTKPSQSSTPVSSAPPTNMFGNISKASDVSKSTAPPTSAAPSFFGNMNKAQDTPNTVGDAKTSSQAQAPIASSTSNVFGKPGQAATSSAAAQSNVPATETQGNTKAAANTTFGQSTSGPAPSAQSRLKNKSMDEVITRWASDLAKYQKEFQKQAEKVASWDHMLVENSEKIQKLYGSTLEAERATAEVERQITTVENDQDELESWLVRYEEKVDQMISSSGDSLHGPDLERERT
ncbi:MAG: hypothetical protein Q9193_002810, partial [Seirophora villosa]